MDVLVHKSKLEIDGGNFVHREEMYTAEITETGENTFSGGKQLWLAKKKFLGQQP